MHPAAPFGCEKICECLRIPEATFFSWDHVFETPAQMVEAVGEKPEEHELATLPPRFDFFEKLSGQK